MKSFKLYNGKRDKFSLRKKNVGLVSIAIATLALYGIVGGSQTTYAEEQNSTSGQVTSVSAPTEDAKTEKVSTTTSSTVTEASSASSFSRVENTSVSSTQTASEFQNSSTESAPSENSSMSSDGSLLTNGESSKSAKTPNIEGTTPENTAPKSDETIVESTIPKTRAARTRRSVAESSSHISNFSVTVTTKDGTVMNAGASKDLSGQEISLDKIQMNFKIKQDGTLKAGDKIRIPVKLENNAYAAYYANLGSGTAETIPGVGTIKFDFSKKDDLAYEITLNSEFASLSKGQEKTVNVNFSAANGAKFTAQKSKNNIVLNINGSTFTFKPKPRIFEKAQAPFAVYHNLSSDAANSMKIGTSTGDANYYNNMLSSDGKQPGNTKIPTGDIITIHRIKPENGSKIIKIKPEPHRITSTLAISEDGKYLVKNDTSTSIPITNENENKLITLPPKSTDADILKALKKAGKNSSVVIDNGDGTYTIATNLGKMIGDGATTYHDIWPKDDFAQHGDQYQEIDRTDETNKKISEILKKMSVIQGTAHSTRITFADSSINNKITSTSKSYSVEDDGTEKEIKSENINHVTRPSTARSEGQTKITVQYVDTAGNQIATQTYQYGYPGGSLHAQSPNFTAKPQNIPGYTLVRTSNPISSVSGTQLTVDKSIAFTNTDQVFYYVYTVNKSNAKVTYIDDDDNHKVLETKELTGDYNTTDPYRTTETIKKYTDKNYELVSDNYPADGVKYNDKLQTFEVHLKHKVKTETQTKTVKETIHYVYKNDSQASPSHSTSLTFTREVKTDEVTKRSTKGAWSPVTGTFAAVTSPTITGYTADKPIVAAVEGITGDSDDIEKTVVYTANQEKAQVRYIDDTTGATLETKELTGDYNTTDDYRTTETIKKYTDKNYELVSDNYPSNGVTYDTTYKKFEVHLRHKVASVQETKTVTETIKYVYEDNTQAAATKVQTLNFERINTKDLVTNNIVYKGPWIPSTGTFSEVVSPKVDGYTPDKATVAAVEQITGDSADIEETVTYKAVKQKVTYTIIDDTAQKTLKDKEVLTSGDSDTPLSDSARAKYDSIVNAYLAQGYELVSKDPLPAKFDLDSSHDQNVTVHLKHGTTDIQETKKVSLTVRYHGAGSQTPANNVQTATWTRTVTKDKITGTEVSATAWTSDKTNYDAVPSPVIPGYRVDVATVPSETVTQEDIVKDVHYTIQTQRVTYTVVDDTTGTTLEHQVELTTGESDAALPAAAQRKYDTVVSAYLAQGYELVSKDPLPAKFDLDSSYDQNVTVHLKHGTTDIQETKKVSLTVRYHGAGSQTPANNVQTATWTRTVTKDKITGTEVSATAWTSDKANYDAVPSPVIPGYRVDVATVPSETVTQEDIVKDVHYTIQTQRVTYTVVDDTTGTTLEHQVELTTGESDAALPAAAQRKYDTVVSGYLAQGYELVSKDSLPAKFDLDSSHDQNVTVHLKHKVTTSSEIKTVKETIHYVYKNGSQASPSRSTSLTFTREVKTDEVTKRSTKGAWSPVTGTFAAVTSPTITGYTADKPIVAAVEGITGDSDDIEKTVVYTANQEKAQVRYIDDTTGATLETKELTGDYNTTDAYRTTETIKKYTDKNYELVSDNYPADGVTYNTTYQKFEVHLRHKVASVEETKTVTETIKYVYENGDQAATPKVQKLDFKRTNTKDLVTGKISQEGVWAPSTGTFSEVVSPTVDGYTPDKSKVDAVTITAAHSDIHVTVTYKADKQKVTYTIIDDTAHKTLKDKEVLTSGDSDTPLSDSARAKYDSIVNAYLAQGYELVSKDPLPAKFDLDSSYDQNVTVHLKHGTTDIQETKKVSLTVRYHGAGSQTPANNVQTATWTRTVTKDKITGTEVSATAWTSDKANYDAVPSPVIPGYRVDVATVPSETVTQEDIVKDVHYTIQTQRVTYTVVDDTTGTTLEHQVELTTGESDAALPAAAQRKYDTVVSAYLAQGYELVSKDPLPAKFDLDSSHDQNVTVHLKHGTTDIQETKKVSLTVRYHGAGSQTPANNVQTATWTRTVTKDKITGTEVSATAWTSDKANYDAVPSPVIPGYRVDVATVPSETVTQEDIVKDVHYTANPVTPDKPTPPVVPSVSDKPAPPTLTFVQTPPTKPASAKEKFLPSTGDVQDGSTLTMLTGIGLLLSALGLVGRCKKED
ncbi:mucin-binding protein [Streptococcus constellatus]|uniref:mucin-binding protein n=5 Tax=Streptococcus TaxID=1301 RepID=UPI002103CFF7|nr:MucBP domain-containing protein [Streptococcus constellatus]UTX65281.1 cell wall protein [Streptococcus constellatus]